MYQRGSVRRVPSAAAPFQAATPAPIPDWSKLGRGDDVEVSACRGPAVPGRIDMVAADRSVFWMIRQDGGGRTMVCAGDDVTVVMVARAKTAPVLEHAAA